MYVHRQSEYFIRLTGVTSLTVLLAFGHPTVWQNCVHAHRMLSHRVKVSLS